MAWLYGDSFDHYNTAQINRKWNALTGSPAISAGQGRFSTAGIGLTSYSLVRKTLDTPGPTGSTSIIGCAFRVPVAPVSSGIDLYTIMDTTTAQFSLCLNSDMTLSVLRGTYMGTTLGKTVRALNVGVWFYIETKVLIDAAAGTVDLKVNGESWAPFPLTGQNTRGATVTTYTNFQLGPSSGNSGGTFYADDLYVLDGSGSAPLNDFLGDTRVEAIFPNNNGQYSEFMGNDANQVNNYQQVDENPADDDTSYVYAQTIGTRDTYTFPAIASDGTIRCVQHWLAMKKDDTATKTVKSLCRDHDNADHDSTATQNPGQTTYDYYRFNYTQDPATSATWAKADLTNTQFGVKITQ